MAVLSTHTLNAVDGTHAAGIAVTLYRIAPSGEPCEVFSSATDEGGRLSRTVDLSAGGEAARFELVLQTGAYFDAQGLPGRGIVPEVVIRLDMPDPDARYHVPLILSPNGYSVWWSG